MQGFINEKIENIEEKVRIRTADTLHYDEEQIKKQILNFLLDEENEFDL